MKKMYLFKIGMWIGMGATVGKWFGECVNAALEGVSIGVISGLAGFGNKHAQEVCDAHGLDCKKLDEESESEQESYDDLKVNYKKEEAENVQPIWTNLHDINEKEGGE